MTIRINDLHAIKLIAMAAEVQFVPKLHSCIARYSKEKDSLLGGVLFTDFRGGSVVMHWAGFHPNWISRSLIWLSFDYPFRQLDVNKVFGLTPESNIIARNTALRFGFKIEHVIDDVFKRADGFNSLYVLGLRKEDCKWLDMPVPVIEWAPLNKTSNVDRIWAQMPSEMRH
jgi:hypothetical protein